MRQGGFLFFISFTLIVVLVCEVGLNSCASRATPSGGPRDTLAPALDTSFPPNYSLFFNAKEIELVFDEYLALKNPNQQVMISPLLDEKPEILLKGKSILITLNDSLAKNTTYTISFGTSITDYTEGNINKNFRYVFSTGSYIDSLSTHGTVEDAYTGDPDQGMLVALYEMPAQDTIVPDSIPFFRTPNYYAYTDEGGNFRMENLKAGKFLLIAFEDRRGDFKLITGQEKIAFPNSIIYTSDSTSHIELRSFNPKPPYKFLGARHASAGKIQFNFNRPVPEIEVRSIGDRNEEKQPGLYLFNEKKDTLYYWFEGEADSLSFFIGGYGISDTADIHLRQYEKPKLKLTNLRNNLRATDTLEIKSNLPVKKIIPDSIFAYSPKDTFALSSVESEDPRELRFLPEQRPEKYTVRLNEGAAHGFFDAKSDSLQFSVTSLKRQDLGNLDFKVVADSNASYVLEIYNGKQERMLRESFTGEVTVELHNYIPGKYSALLVADTDGNGEWTTGDYFLKRQAEKIIEYSEPIDIRANWDLELEWIVKPATKAETNPDPLKN